MVTLDEVSVSSAPEVGAYHRSHQTTRVNRQEVAQQRADTHYQVDQRLREFILDRAAAGATMPPVPGSEDDRSTRAGRGFWTECDRFMAKAGLRADRVSHAHSVKEARRYWAHRWWNHADPNIVKRKPDRGAWAWASSVSRGSRDFSEKEKDSIALLVWGTSTSHGAVSSTKSFVGTSRASALISEKLLPLGERRCENDVKNWLKTADAKGRVKNFAEEPAASRRALKSFMAAAPVSEAQSQSQSQAESPLVACPETATEWVSPSDESHVGGEEEASDDSDEGGDGAGARHDVVAMTEDGDDIEGSQYGYQHDPDFAFPALAAALAESDEHAAAAAALDFGGAAPVDSAPVDPTGEVLV